MNLKALATQLECQGVDPGYIQRIDWEDWILSSVGFIETDERTRDFVRMRSLVLYLLQEHLRGSRGDLEDRLSPLLYAQGTRGIL